MHAYIVCSYVHIIFVIDVILTLLLWNIFIERYIVLISVFGRLNFTAPFHNAFIYPSWSFSRSSAGWVQNFEILPSHSYCCWGLSVKNSRNNLSKKIVYVHSLHNAIQNKLYGRSIHQQIWFGIENSDTRWLWKDPYINHVMFLWDVSINVLLGQWNVSLIVLNSIFRSV